MRTCTNCWHCKTNMINESECCLGREINTTECSAFAPKNEYIEEYLQQDKREKVFPSILTWAGIGSIAFSLYFCCLGWLEGSWGNPYLWTLLVIGVICLAVTGIMPLVLRLRRESLKQEVRKELENEVRSDVAPKMLTRNIIKDYLEQQGLSPEPIDGAEDLKFTSHDTRYAIYYDIDHRRITIRYTCPLEEEYTDIFDGIIKCCEGEVFGVKRKIQEFTQENGQNVYILFCNVEFFVEYVDHFKCVFPRYLHSIEFSVNNILLLLNRFKQSAQDINGFRNDIYNPEYRLIPHMLQGVKADRLLPDALVDEEWIRKEIQTRCSNNECKEEWNYFKINRVNKFGNYKLIVYQFPEPKFVPEAKYGVVLHNTSSLESSYYTLEMGHDGIWYYGGVIDDINLYYGRAESDSIDHFIEWIFSNDKQIEASTDYNKG